MNNDSDSFYCFTYYSQINFKEYLIVFVLIINCIITINHNPKFIIIDTILTTIITTNIFFNFLLKHHDIQAKSREYPFYGKLWAIL